MTANVLRRRRRNNNHDFSSVAASTVFVVVVVAVLLLAGNVQFSAATLQSGSLIIYVTKVRFFHSKLISR